MMRSHIYESSYPSSSLLSVDCCLLIRRLARIHRLNLSPSLCKITLSAQFITWLLSLACSVLADLVSFPTVYVFLALIIVPVVCLLTSVLCSSNRVLETAPPTNWWCLVLRMTSETSCHVNENYVSIWLCFIENSCIKLIFYQPDELLS